MVNLCKGDKIMLKVSHLSKSFGDLQVLNDISFQVSSGKIIGLIGKNGSGKSTTFRLILNFLYPDQGEILWKNQPLTSAVYNEIGYLPEERGLIVEATVEEQLLFLAELKGCKRQEVAAEIDSWLQRFQVQGKRTDRIKQLSKGNQQKIQLIASLIHHPQLVILDEPFSGLDPVNTSVLKREILKLKEQGACVIFSSHNMDNVTELCDELVMIHNRKVVLEGTVSSIFQQFGRNKIFLESSHTPEELAAIEGVISVTPAKHGGLMLHLESESVGRRVFDYVVSQGYFYTFHQQHLTLEEIFQIKVKETQQHEEV